MPTAHRVGSSVHSSSAGLSRLGRSCFASAVSEAAPPGLAVPFRLHTVVRQQRQRPLAIWSAAICLFLFRSLCGVGKLCCGMARGVVRAA